MSTRTSFLAKLIGLFLLGMAAPMAIHKSVFVATIDGVVRDQGLMLTFGMIALSMGLAMILAHNVWRGGATPVLVTLIGWLALAKGLMLLFVPPPAMVPLLDIVKFAHGYYGYVALYVVLGGFLTWGGFRGRPAIS